MARLTHLNGATVEVADDQVDVFVGAGFSRSDDAEGGHKTHRAATKKAPAKAENTDA